jgi:hypothetical protein
MTWKLGETIYRSKDEGTSWPIAELPKSSLQMTTVNAYIDWLLQMGADFEVRTYLNTLLIKSNVSSLDTWRTASPAPKKAPVKRGGIKKRTRW